ncbi:tRNA pseudouridine(38/39) synthase-like isoform X1 [Chenopodium quinoa]|uniref:tRNA pseudouridine(38/39) synthase-like isoform X1 n=1 Tax=Chenopodium quinoa TaxID=63459 RepID=UPI000B7967EA|nr:tRNA pseudouridine(38/39) synthase-like isoform X1 [Chenopodium quinoa]
MENDRLISSLRSQIDSLHCRIKNLEVENAEMASKLSHCRCSKVENASDSSVSNDLASVEIAQNLHQKSGKSRKTKSQDSNVSILHHHPKRYVALKVFYFGQRFYGFASEVQMEPTVESELFKAFEKTRLLIDDRKGSQYSRCGRTDKGVSAVGQVIALYLRSNLKAETSSDRVVCEGQYEGEIDYVRILNKVLPKDIRITGWSPAPVDFHARFGCLSREYKYFFWSENLNISAMQTAAKKYLGEHDFRNFCKMDAVNVHNYKRCITSFDITPSSEKFKDKELWAIIIRGSAFLWHQVRCMVAVLFMIGRGLESVEIIDVLLDIERTPKKPQYTMASALPLVLSSCEFEGPQFFTSADARQALCAHLENECQNFMLQFAIFSNALDSCSSIEDDEGRHSLTKAAGMKKCVHIPLRTRPTEPSYEERRAKLNS